jgi:hypothetical protein
MINIHNAIIELYPQVVSIRGDVAYDVDNNEVAYDLSAATAQAKKDDCKAKAKVLLSQTDWAVLPDVSDPLKSNPYLTNVNEFLAYRNAIRAIAVTPTAGWLTWPDIPKAVWR